MISPYVRMYVRRVIKIAFNSAFWQTLHIVLLYGWACPVCYFIILEWELRYNMEGGCSITSDLTY